MGVGGLVEIRKGLCFTTLLQPTHTRVCMYMYMCVCVAHNFRISIVGLDPEKKSTW